MSQFNFLQATTTTKKINKMPLNVYPCLMFPIFCSFLPSLPISYFLLLLQLNTRHSERKEKISVTLKQKQNFFLKIFFYLLVSFQLVARMIRFHHCEWKEMKYNKKKYGVVFDDDFLKKSWDGNFGLWGRKVEKLKGKIENFYKNLKKNLKIKLREKFKKNSKKSKISPQKIQNFLITSIKFHPLANLLSNMWVFSVELLKWRLGKKAKSTKNVSKSLLMTSSSAVLLQTMKTQQRDFSQKMKNL